MAFPQWYAGQVITADRLNSRHTRVVYQEADIELTDQGNYQDSQIAVDLEPNSVYWYELCIAYMAHIDADFQWTWESETATDVNLSSYTQAYTLDAQSHHNTGSTVIFRRPANTTDRLAGGADEDVVLSAYDKGTMTVGPNPSTMRMKFCQVSPGTGTTRLRGGNQTRMIYYRIE